MKWTTAPNAMLSVLSGYLGMVIIALSPATNAAGLVRLNLLRIKHFKGEGVWVNVESELQQNNE